MKTIKRVQAVIEKTDKLMELNQKFRDKPYNWTQEEHQKMFLMIYSQQEMLTLILNDLKQI